MQLFEEEKSAPAWYMCQSYVPKYVLKWSPASEPDCRLTKLFWRARLTIWLGNSDNIGNGNIWSGRADKVLGNNDCGILHLCWQDLQHLV